MGLLQTNNVNYSFKPRQCTVAWVGGEVFSDHCHGIDAICRCNSTLTIRHWLLLLLLLLEEHWPFHILICHSVIMGLHPPPSHSNVTAALLFYLAL